jgi:hypothetical protein
MARMSEEEADDHNDYQRELAAERAEPVLQIRKLHGGRFEVWSSDDGRMVAICPTRQAAEHCIKVRTERERDNEHNVEDGVQYDGMERPGAIDHEVKF